MQRDPSDLSPCNKTLQIPGGSFRQLKPRLAFLPPPNRPCSPPLVIDPAHPTSWSNGLACSLTSGCPSRVGRPGGYWSGAWAALGEGGRRGAGSSLGVRGPVLLAERAHLLLTTGAAELCNCSLPGVQGAISRQGEESFCDYFRSHGARFSPHSLKDFSHFSDSFAVRLLF